MAQSIDGLDANFLEEGQDLIVVLCNMLDAVTVIRETESPPSLEICL